MKNGLQNSQGDKMWRDGHVFTLESVISFGGTVETWLARIDYGTLFVVKVANHTITSIR